MPNEKDSQAEVADKGVERMNRIFKDEENLQIKEFMRHRAEMLPGVASLYLTALVGAVCGIAAVRLPEPYSFGGFLAIFTVAPASGLAIELLKMYFGAKRIH